MNFSKALELLKQGKKLARAGWNGKGQFVYFVAGGNYPAQMDAIKGVFENDLVPYRPYMALKTAQGDVATWVPSVSDILAEDWEIVSEDETIQKKFSYSIEEIIKTEESIGLPIPLSVIPNYMGINLVSVDRIEWSELKDGQLVSLNIIFKPGGNHD